MKRHQKEKVNRKCVELKNTTGRKKKKRQIASRKNKTQQGSEKGNKALIEDSQVK